MRRAAALLLYGTALAPLVVLPGTAFSGVVGRALSFRALVLGTALLCLVHLVRRRGSAGGTDGAGGGRARPQSRGAGGRATGDVGTESIPVDPVLLALLAFLAVGLGAGLLGVAPARSWFGTLERMGGLVAWLHLAVFYALLRAVLRSGREWEELFTVSVLASVALGLQALLQAVPDLVPAGWLYATRGGRVSATAGNPGPLSAYALLHLCVAALMWSRSESSGWRRFFAAAALLNGTVLVLTGTRGAFVGAIAASLAVAAWLAVRPRAIATPDRSRALRLLLPAGGVALLLLAGVAALSGQLDRLLDLGLGSSSVRVRLFAWSYALQGAAEAPLAGVGPENFLHVHHRHFRPAEYLYQSSVQHFDYAHNAFLHHLSTAGIPGLVAYGAVFGTALLGLRRALRAGALGTGEGAAALAALVGYPVYLFFWFEDHLSTPLFVAVCAFVWHAAGAREAGKGRVAPAAGRRRWRRRLRVGGAAVALGAMLATLPSQVGALRASRTIGSAAALEDPWRKAERYEAALEQAGPYRRDVAVAYARYLKEIGGWAALRSRGDAATGREALAALRSARAAVERALRSEPWNLRLRLNAHAMAAISHRISGDPADLEVALARLREAVRRNPRRSHLRVELSERLLEAGRTEEALREAERAIGIFDGYGSPYYQRARVRQARGDREGALRDVYRAFARRYVPGNPDLLLSLGRWLEEEGTPFEAARLHLLYLALKPPGLDLAADSSRRPRTRYFRLADRRIVGELPLLLLRAGERELAERTTRRILERMEAFPESVGPEERAAARRFLRELRAGGAGAPLGWRSITRPPPEAG